MEDFLHFICPWLRVRGGRIFLLVVLCSILTAKAVVNAESEVMCYSGIIITTNANTISLSKKSLSDFSLDKCQAPTTANPTTELMTSTDMLATTSTIESTSSAMTFPDSTINTVMEASTEMASTSPDLTTSSKPTPTDAPKGGTTQNSTHSAKNSTTITPQGQPGKRRRRSLDNDKLTDHGPSHDRNFTCQVFYYSNSKDDKMQSNTTYTLEFSCVTEETEKLCEGKELNNQKIGNHTGTLYCCNGPACNSPLNVTWNTNISVETLNSCSSYNEVGIFHSFPCVGEETHMCLNITDKKSNTTGYTCGNSQSEDEYCIKEYWYSEQCKESDGKTYCCYVEPTFVKVPSKEKPPNSSVGIIIGIIVAFATGLFLGCVGLVILQKKCGKGRTSGIEMDFSYSRFQSADSGTDEL